MTAVILGLLSGLAFGYVVTRAGATNPHKMARSHLMIDPSIPQFMLMTVLLSAIGLTALVAVGSVKATTILPTSILATGVAAIIFGCGWGLTGYCPGTTWAAVGEGRFDAIWALFGGFAGTATFSHFHEQIIPVIYQPTNVGQITLTSAFGGNRVLALAVLVVMLGISIYLIGKFWSSSPEKAS